MRKQRVVLAVVSVAAGLGAAGATGYALANDASAPRVAPHGGGTVPVDPLGRITITCAGMCLPGPRTQVIEFDMHQWRASGGQLRVPIGGTTSRRASELLYRAGTATTGQIRSLSPQDWAGLAKAAGGQYCGPGCDGPVLRYEAYTEAGWVDVPCVEKIDLGSRFCIAARVVEGQAEAAGLERFFWERALASHSAQAPR